MPEYIQPGVYVEEVPTGARPISAASTGTAAFFGIAPDARAAPRSPVPVTSFADFQRTFAGDTATSTQLACAVDGFFANGGTRLHVINLGQGAKRIEEGDLAVIEPIEGISLVAAPGFTDAGTYEAMIGACEARSDWLAVLDCAPKIDDVADLARPMAVGGLRPRSARNGVAAFYAPWIVMADPIGRGRIAAAPSGAVCGLYARNDAQRGVHKAPAGLPVSGALGVTHLITEREQAVLNPAGVNAIRQFPDGIKVWGARTLADAAGDWLYVPVRRLATMIEQSIGRGTRWAVFEPNDEPLWTALRRDAGAFLHGLWREGALAGGKPDEAYFVKCGRDTMTQADIDSGTVIALVGIAPVRPAEFIVIRIVQSAAGTR